MLRFPGQHGLQDPRTLAALGAAPTSEQVLAAIQGPLAAVMSGQLHSAFLPLPINLQAAALQQPKQKKLNKGRWTAEEVRRHHRCARPASRSPAWR